MCRSCADENSEGKGGGRSEDEGEVHFYLDVRDIGVTCEILVWLVRYVG